MTNTAPSSPLFKAVEAGSVPEVARLLETGADLDEEGQHGQTVLFRALALGNAQVIDLLVGAGADLKARSDSGKRIIDVAIETGHHTLVDRILALGEPLIAVNRNGFTSLHWAAKSGDLSLVKKVLEQGSFSGEEKNASNDRPLEYAGSAEVFNFLIERFNPAEINPKFGNGNYSVHRFAQQGKAGIVRSLIERGVPVDLAGKDKNTILHFAAASASTELIGYLLSVKAKVNARNKRGYTPLHWLAETSNIEAARLLLDHGAKVDGKTNSVHIVQENQTPLYRAVEKHQFAMARFLIESGADVNIVCSSSGETALTAACRADDIELIDILLTHGSSPNGVEPSPGMGFSSFPLGCAISRATVERLVRAGADVNAVDRNRDTALHHLAFLWDEEAIAGELGRGILGALDALLEAGADPRARNKGLATPAELARAPQVAKRLRR